MVTLPRKKVWHCPCFNRQLVKQYFCCHYVSRCDHYQIAAIFWKEALRDSCLSKISRTSRCIRNRMDISRICIAPLISYWNSEDTITPSAIQFCIPYRLRISGLYDVKLVSNALRAPEKDTSSCLEAQLIFTLGT